MKTSKTGLSSKSRWLTAIFVAVVFLIQSQTSTRLASASPLSQTTPTVEETDVAPVITVTPRPDGAVVHIVEYGQTLYDIALAYGISITKIKELNFLTTSDIYVGQKLVIQIASSPTPVGSPSATPTGPSATPAPSKTPRPTRTPTRTLSPEEQVTPTPIPSPTPIPTPGLLSQATADPILLGILAIGFSGVVLMAVGMVMKKKE